MPDHSSSQTPDTPIIELQSIDSTNNYARGQIDNGSARHGMTILAQEQAAGKGQRGRQWLSEKGSNLILTILLNPRPLKISEQFQLNVMVAVTLHSFFSKLAGPDTKIKWPNDLYWQDRKAGGVLIESIVGSHESGVGSPKVGKFESQEDESFDIETPNEPKSPVWKWAIVGIGVNINQTVFDEELKNPVSLKQITGKNFNVIDLAKELANELMKNFKQLVENGFDHFLELYDTNLYKKGQFVKLKKDNRIFEARVKAVKSNGELVIKHAVEENISFGNIEWLI